MLGTARPGVPSPGVLARNGHVSPSPNAAHRPCRRRPTASEAVSVTMTTTSAALATSTLGSIPNQVATGVRGVIVASAGGLPEAGAGEPPTGPDAAADGSLAGPSEGRALGSRLGPSLGAALWLGLGLGRLEGRAWLGGVATGAGFDTTAVVKW